MFGGRMRGAEEGSDRDCCAGILGRRRLAAVEGETRTRTSVAGARQEEVDVAVVRTTYLGLRRTRDNDQSVSSLRSSKLMPERSDLDPAARTLLPRLPAHRLRRADRRVPGCSASSASLPCRRPTANRRCSTRRPSPRRHRRPCVRCSAAASGSSGSSAGLDAAAEGSSRDVAGSMDLERRRSGMLGTGRPRLMGRRTMGGKVERTCCRIVAAVGWDT